MRLLGRLHAEGDLLPRIITSQFGDVLKRFGAALRAALPGLAAGRVVLAPESGHRRPGSDSARRIERPGQTIPTFPFP